MSTAAPLIDEKMCFDRPDSLVTSDATALLRTPLVPCTMTWKIWSGFAVAAASRVAGTNAVPPRVLPGVRTPGSAGPPEPAMPAAGIASPVTRAIRTVKPPSRVRTRPPLPQRAFFRAPQGLEFNLMMVGTPFLPRLPERA
jgi:hypothetical protein